MNNNWPVLFAFRYLRGKRTGNAVPVLSRISITAIAVASAAMVVTFSVFNGFEFLLEDMYRSFYPQLKIVPAKGKFFPLVDVDTGALRKVAGVQLLSPLIEDNALATDVDDVNGTFNRQKVVLVRGVDNNYFKINSLHDFDGVDTVSNGPRPTAVAGYLVLRELGVNYDNEFQHMYLYYPDADVKNPELNPEAAFRSLKLKPTGVFYIGDEFDDRYVLAPFEQVQRLLHVEGKVSAIDISTEPGREERIKVHLQQQLGPGLKVLNRKEQNPTVYMIVSSEKFVIFLIFIFILIIASFNMVGALFTIVIEKKKDLAILRTMGALPASIRNIFIAEGVIWGLTGGLSGVVVGIIICIIQRQFGLVKMPGAFVTDVFPVIVSIKDTLLILTATVVISFVASLFPASRAARLIDFSLKSN